MFALSSWSCSFMLLLYVRASLRFFYKLLCVSINHLMSWCNISVFKTLLFDGFYKFFALAWWASVCVVRSYYFKHSASPTPPPPPIFGITATADVLYMYYFYYRAILNNHQPLQYPILNCGIWSTEVHQYILP